MASDVLSTPTGGYEVTWQVSITDDEILLEYRSGENYVVISLDETGPGYSIKEGGSFQPGRYDLEGIDFPLALNDIRQACTQE
jgi:hypothetical protein